MKILILIVALFLFRTSILSSFELEIYMHVTDQREINFPNGNKYIQLEGSANWKDTQGDYGVINCLATITTKNQEESAILQAFCEGKNQNEEKFWLNLNRTSDMEIGIGIATYIYGDGKYKSLKGKKCHYAVNYFEDRMFYKQKCKL